MINTKRCSQLVLTKWIGTILIKVIMYGRQFKKLGNLDSK